MTLSARTVGTLATGALLGFLVAIGGDVFANREPARDAAPPLTNDPNASGLPWQEAQLLAEVLERVKREYVEPVDDHTLIDNAVRGLVSGLDPYSAFLDEQEFDDMRVSTAGSYPGVGIEVAPAPEGIRIVRPFDDSPAERAGIRAGDMVTAIDGVVIGADVDAAIQRMRGPTGSSVRLSVRRAGETLPLEFVLKRAQVEVHSVRTAPLEPRYAYIRISHFSETTPQDFAHAIANITRAPAKPLRGVVIDLRNNPGGVLEAAVEVADALLERGRVVSADGRTKDARFVMEATTGEVLPGVPVVLLVNHGSASAAEILAGALQDHGRAKLIGRTTFGKGSVQTVMPMSQGRAIKLTTSHYFTPSGRSIDGRGIAPDVLLAGEEPEPIDLGEITSHGALALRDSDIAAALAELKAPTPSVPSGARTAQAR
jgi:carboxyl-terminal processing protease